MMNNISTFILLNEAYNRLSVSVNGSTSPDVCLNDIDHLQKQRLKQMLSKCLKAHLKSTVGRVRHD